MPDVGPYPSPVIRTFWPKAGSSAVVTEAVSFWPSGPVAVFGPPASA